MLIRPAEPSDLPAVQATYAIEVLEGTASFETTPPDLEEIERRYREVIDSGLPYVVADVDGVVAGYAFAHLYHSRPGYRLTVETTIYIGRSHQRRGLGSLLLDDVVKDCIAAGKRQMVAIIGGSANQGSVRVHEKAGFHLVGRLHHVGFKFGQFIDVIIMQRSLGHEEQTTG